MKKLFITALTLLLLATNIACTTNANAGYITVVKPATFLVSKEFIKKKPEIAQKLLIVADGLDLTAGLSKRDLALDDFIAIINRAGQEAEWAVLANYLYDIYRDNVTVPESVDKVAPVLRAIAQGIRDSVVAASPSK